MRDTRTGQWVVAAFAAMVVAVFAYFVLGMPGMDHGGGSPGSSMAGMGGVDHATMAVGVDDFARRMAVPTAFVVNVHVPDQGSIDGTDAAIAYDRILEADGLPADKSTPILVYCQTGTMSEAAAATLMDAGYTDVVYLDGGMYAWVRAGRSLS